MVDINVLNAIRDFVRNLSTIAIEEPGDIKIPQDDNLCECGCGNDCSFGCITSYWVSPIIGKTFQIYCDCDLGCGCNVPEENKKRVEGKDHKSWDENKEWNYILQKTQLLRKEKNNG